MLLRGRRGGAAHVYVRDNVAERQKWRRSKQTTINEAMVLGDTGEGGGDTYLFMREYCWEAEVEKEETHTD